MRKKQIKLLDILDEYGYDIFSLNMLKAKLPDNELRPALKSLTNSGILVSTEFLWINGTISKYNICSNLFTEKLYRRISKNKICQSKKTEIDGLFRTRVGKS